MSNGTPHLSSLLRTLTMLEAVIADGGRSTVSELARRTGMPGATAHRQVATLVKAGYLSVSATGRHIAGSRLLGLSLLLDEKQIIVNKAAPVLHRLASAVGSVVQLGTFENDMVTYRLKTGQGAAGLFTQVGMQLEAYCSGMGKVLLAHLPEEERERYLAQGPFVALTGTTITDPARLRQELLSVRSRGHALDQGEIAPDLRCIAVPILRQDGFAPAAISVSRTLSPGDPGDHADDLSLLLDAAREVAAQVYHAAGP